MIAPPEWYRWRVNVLDPDGSWVLGHYRFFITAWLDAQIHLHLLAGVDDRTGIVISKRMKITDAPRCDNKGCACRASHKEIH